MFIPLKILNKYACALVVLSLLSACSKKQEELGSVVKTPTVKVIDVAGNSTGALRQFPAEVEANQDSHLAFRVGGELSIFAVKAGNRVKKGQLLAKLDPTDFEIKLNDRQARYTLAKAQFKRAEQLLVKKLVSQAQFDEAKANLLVAESTLRSAKIALEYTTLRAPYDGLIAKVYAENLQNIRAQQVILDMQNVDTLDVSIQVPERIIATLNRDNKYQPMVAFDFDPDTQYRLTIKEWDAQADLLTRTYKIVFSMPIPANTNILPGMTGIVYADMNQVLQQSYVKNKVIIVPVVAVFSDQGEALSDNKRYVWQVIDDMSIKKVAVEVGEINGQGIVVLSGLTGGEKIVGAGVHYLQEGMTVRAWQRERGL